MNKFLRTGLPLVIIIVAATMFVLREFRSTAEEARKAAEQASQTIETLVEVRDMALDSLNVDTQKINEQLRRIGEGVGEAIEAADSVRRIRR